MGLSVMMQIAGPKRLMGICFARETFLCSFAGVVQVGHGLCTYSSQQNGFALKPLELAIPETFQLTAGREKHFFPVVPFAGGNSAMVLMKAAFTWQDKKIFCFFEYPEPAIDVQIQTTATWKVKSFIGTANAVPVGFRSKQAIAFHKGLEYAAWIGFPLLLIRKSG